MNALPPKKTPQNPGGGGETGGGSGGGGGGGGGGSTNLAPALTEAEAVAHELPQGQSTTISFRLSEAAKVRCRSSASWGAGGCTGAA